MEFHVKKLDFGSVLTEDVGHRTRTRGIENGEKLLEYLLGVFQQKLKENKLDEFVVKFEINSPPPKQG